MDRKKLRPLLIALAIPLSAVGCQSAESIDEQRSSVLGDGNDSYYNRYQLINFINDAGMRIHNEEAYSIEVDQYLVTDHSAQPMAEESRVILSGYYEDGKMRIVQEGLLGTAGDRVVQTVSVYNGTWLRIVNHQLDEVWDFNMSSLPDAIRSRALDYLIGGLEVPECLNYYNTEYDEVDGRYVLRSQGFFRQDGQEMFMEIHANRYSGDIERQITKARSTLPDSSTVEMTIESLVDRTIVSDVPDYHFNLPTIPTGYARIDKTSQASSQLTGTAQCY